MDEREQLLRAIIANPKDATLRGAYGDWMREHDASEIEVGVTCSYLSTLEAGVELICVMRALCEDLRPVMTGLASAMPFELDLSWWER